ncbi:rotamase-domain-containing protein [Acaromyces ingoldii]|uniref:Peptidyl-prolyl cis-trans isomerase n=1 Tax=Acaromyces ingoldii TaxID=215250 RepID=A0A316YRC9_9BASI|nr:rotamase-domain-containing protein [Acaromyces ingoldii]PWN90335.1 rotamase-domain-containing protein [Acaromyces ingoldii]
MRTKSETLAESKKQWHIRRSLNVMTLTSNDRSGKRIRWGKLAPPFEALFHSQGLGGTEGKGEKVRGTRGSDAAPPRTRPSVAHSPSSKPDNQAMSSSQDWEVRFSNSRQLPYFYDRATNTSVWEKPDSISEEEVASLPGANYLGGATGQAAEPAQVRASHLLVKHRNSRRPSSWKESNITRSPEEAEAILLEHAKTLGPNPSAQDFAALAKVHSDCSSAQKGGDLGFFAKGQMQKAFEDAAFSLPVGKLSDVVKSDSGHHLIIRTA